MSVKMYKIFLVELELGTECDVLELVCLAVLLYACNDSTMASLSCAYTSPIM